MNWTEYIHILKTHLVKVVKIWYHIHNGSDNAVSQHASLNTDILFWTTQIIIIIVYLETHCIPMNLCIIKFVCLNA